jgi:ADP-ribosylglycohydrolase
MCDNVAPVACADPPEHDDLPRRGALLARVRHCAPETIAAAAAATSASSRDDRRVLATHLGLQERAAPRQARCEV